MPQSIDQILLHLIYITKDRAPYLNKKIRGDVHAYLAATARNVGCYCLRVGGVEDHVHIAVRLGRTIAVSQLVLELKVQSSKWIKMQSPDTGNFSWQRGYAVFSVSPADQNALIEYIDNQEKHHESKSFQDELRAFFKKYNVTFDEKYVWD